MENKINKKKILICISLILSIILIIAISLIIRHSIIRQKQYGEIVGENRIFKDTSNTIQIEVSKNYELKQYTSYSDYLLELRNDNNLNVFVKKLNYDLNESLQNLIRADRTTYIKEFSSISNLSDIKDFEINNHSAATYSFHYLDQNQNIAYYLQVVFMQIENNIYVFDFDFPLTDLSTYNGFITDILNNFSEI